MSEEKLHIKNIPGASEIYKQLGNWPIFHDSEVAAINLIRNGPSSLHIVSPVNSFTSEHLQRWCICLQFSEIVEIELVDFNHQNVLYDLTFTLKDNLYSVNIDSSFGVDGFITAKTLLFKMSEFPFEK